MSQTPERIAIIAGRMNGGGVESVVMNYYRNIDRQQFQYDFYVNSDSRRVPVEEIQRLGGRVYVIPRYAAIVGYQRRLHSMLAQHNYLIVHSHVNSLSVLPLAIAKRCNIPVRIAHSHSVGGPGEPMSMAIKNTLKLFLHKYSTVQLACSDAAGRWLFGQKGSYELVNNAISISDYEFNDSHRTSMRNSLGIEPNCFVIGHAGRFVPVKDHDKVIEIFSEFRRLKPDSKLILVGDGPLFGKFQKKYSSMVKDGAVKFLGHRTDMHRLYQAFDAFVLPSKYEGLGLVGVEAQASGLPCLFSEGIPREVRLTDDVEFLPTSQPNLWADALLKVSQRKGTNDPRLANYDIKMAASHLERIYTRELEKVRVNA